MSAAEEIRDAVRARDEDRRVRRERWTPETVWREALVRMRQIAEAETPATPPPRSPAYLARLERAAAQPTQVDEDRVRRRVVDLHEADLYEQAYSGLDEVDPKTEAKLERGIERELAKLTREAIEAARAEPNSAAKILAMSAPPREVRLARLLERDAERLLAEALRAVLAPGDVDVGPPDADSGPRSTRLRSDGSVGEPVWLSVPEWVARGVLVELHRLTSTRPCALGGPPKPLPRLTLADMSATAEHLIAGVLIKPTAPPPARVASW